MMFPIKIKNKSNNNNNKVSKPPMKKKSKIAVWIILGLFYSILMFAIVFTHYQKGVSDRNVNTFCYDEVNAFSAEEVAQIDQKCKAVQQKYGVNVYVATCLRQYNRATKIGTQFLSEHSLSKKDNLVVIIINMNQSSIGFENYHFDLYAYGDYYNRVSEGEVEKLLFSEAGDKMIVGGSTTVEGTIEMTENFAIACTWIYTRSWTFVFVIAGVITLVISLITISVIKGKYKKDRYVQNFEFTTNSNLNLELKEDKYSHKTVTYVHIHRSSSGGSGGGFSGGGGGLGHLGGR